MNYCLISPRLAIQKGDVLGSGVPYWPTELAILAGQIRQHHSVQLLDLFGLSPSTLEEQKTYYLQGMSHTDLILSIISDTDVVIVFAISFMSHLEILEIISLVRSNFPKVKLIVMENSQAVTGYDLELHKSEFFQAGADIIICGDAYSNWENIQTSIENLTSDNNSLIFKNQKSNKTISRYTNNWGGSPWPAWDLVPVNNYWKLPYSHGPKNKKYLPILTSKGCPYSCDFCVIPSTNSRRWRPRLPHDVVGEMAHFSKIYGINHFQIEDLNPTVDSNRWDLIAQQIIEKKLNLTYSFVSGTKAETLNLNSLEMYKSSGLNYISISPESGSPNLMRIIGKHFNYSYALDLVSKCRELKIFTQACFIVGHPNETVDDFLQTRSYLKKLLKAGLNEVAVFIVSPFPGSKIHNSKAIDTKSETIFTSFSPKNRLDFRKVSKRRNILVLDFIKFKMFRPKELALHFFRAILGTPQTKLENLPKRLVYVLIAIVRTKFSALVSKNLHSTL